MKRILFFFLVVLSILAQPVLGQDNRTTATRIADALALLPAKDGATSAQAFSELMALDDAGLNSVVEGVRPSGDPLGVPNRYAVALLTQMAVNVGDRMRVENSLLSSLNKSSQVEVRLYYLYHLGRIGTDRSVPALVSLLSEPTLADAAVGSLTSIGTTAADQALRNGLANKPEELQVRIIKALGNRRDASSVTLLIPLAKSSSVSLKREALWSLAVIGSAEAEATLLQQAAAAGYKTSPAQEMEALVQYLGVRARAGANTKTVRTSLLENTLAKEQSHYRLAALRDLVREAPSTSQQALNGELDRFDEGYRRDVLMIASVTAQDPKAREAWIKVYKKSTREKQAEVLMMLASANSNPEFFSQQVVPALDSKNSSVRVAALRAVAATRDSRYADVAGKFLWRADVTKQEREEAVKSFLQVAEKAQVHTLAQQIRAGNPDAVVAILGIVAARRDVDDEQIVIAQTYSSNPEIKTAAFLALPYVSSPSVLPQLFNLLSSVSSAQEIAAVQQSLIAIAGPETSAEILKASATQKVRLLPVLPYLKDPQSLKTVKNSFDQGQGEERDLALSALLNWQNGDAVPSLLAILRKPNSPEHARAFSAGVKQVMNTDWPMDQKLLRLREIFPLASTPDERRLVIREAGNVRTFLSFVFVSSYLDDPELGTVASRSAMRIALPTADAQPGLVGSEVRTGLLKVMDKLTGPDSQYDRIDLQTYLDQMPYTQGFEPIFNGKDLSGWQGLVENPIARAKMPKEELAKKQAEVDAKLSQSWSVKDGMICFTGTGDNLCTKRTYGDFELLVDWKISKNGDSGIYLRGTPQVQIWDTSRVDVGAQVGSGGLYNNTVNRNPLVFADNPIGEWNTLRITMINDRVTVFLNGLLVVDNVVMENYWDRKLPIFADGPIELQAHGTELAFRNVYVRELNKPYQLTAEEKQQGFEVLFNGNDLSNWVGNKTDYVVDDHVIAIYPTERGKGNLYTEKEYADFVFRFDFQLTPAGNNGLGIHAPLEGDAAYVGKEIQILDDGHPTYSNIQPWQAHGSVYGVIAAKRGVLRPVGQWNEEEVEVRGDKIKVTVNGVVIVDGDMAKASFNGTLDKKDHPGLKRHSGHIGFLGHGSVVRFRNIRIRELVKPNH